MFQDSPFPGFHKKQIEPTAKFSTYALLVHWVQNYSTAVCRIFATPEARSDTTPAFLWLVCVVNMAVSCEERRTSAYSADLRWRMVYQVKALGKSYQEVAENLNVDKSTVSRIVALYESSSDVTPKRYPPNSGTSILTEVDKFIILELVIDRPGIYLREIQRELEEQTGTTVDSSTIYVDSYIIRVSQEGNCL